MIINALLNMLYSVFDFLLTPIAIPGLPAEVHNYINTLIEYVGTGIGIISNYTHLDYLLLLFGVVVAIDLGLWLYKIVMYFIRKIPMFGIS